jgi:hypothetical protein
VGSVLVLVGGQPERGLVADRRLRRAYGAAVLADVARVADRTAGEEVELVAAVVLHRHEGAVVGRRAELAREAGPREDPVLALVERHEPEVLARDGVGCPGECRGALEALAHRVGERLVSDVDQAAAARLARPAEHLVGGLVDEAWDLGARHDPVGLGDLDACSRRHQCGDPSGIGKDDSVRPHPGRELEEPSSDHRDVGNVRR